MPYPSDSIKDFFTITNHPSRPADYPHKKYYVCKVKDGKDNPCLQAYSHNTSTTFSSRGDGGAKGTKISRMEMSFLNLFF